MSDPKRLFDDGADDLTKTLLRAGRTLDAEQARERKLALLGAAGAGAAAAATAAVATPSGVKGVLHMVSATALKWLGVGLLAAAAAVGGAAFFARPSPDAADRPESTAQGSEAPPGQNHANPVVLDPNTSQLIPSSEPSETGGAPTPGDQAGGATRPKVAAPSREAPAPEAKASAQSSGAAANSQGDSLTEEVMALKRAREALAAGRPKRPSPSSISTTSAFGEAASPSRPRSFESRRSRSPARGRQRPRAQRAFCRPTRRAPTRTA
jgi:hypothetical protein